MLRKDEQGVAFLLEVMLIAIILGGVGFAGYRIMQSRKDKTATKTTNSTDTSSKTKTVSKAWKDGEFAVKGTYADASVVQIAEGKWRMYYAIQPEVQGNKFEVYSSISTDGKTWTQETGTRKTMATFPEVIKTKEGKWRMYYQSAAVIKSAISTDGLTFKDESGTRVDKANDVGLTFDNVAAPTVELKDDGTYMMVYRGTINTRYAADTPNATTQLLMWATSDDGLTFTKKGIAVDTRDDTLRGQLDGPDIVKWDDNKLHVFATTYAGVYEFVFDGAKFGKGTLAFKLASKTSTTNAPPLGNAAGAAPQQDTAPPGDPTFAKINGVWYMYYGIAFADGGIHTATYQ